MNRNHLALFHAVARAGSISAGAAAVNVSQPAVSKQIGELEGELGLRLLNRLPRGCTLTEAGRILAEYADRWISVEREAQRAMEELRGLKRGRLTVGSSLTIGAYLLPALIAEFHRRHPNIELKVEVANSEAIQNALLDGVFEVGLTEGPLKSELLESKVFYDDVLVPIVPPGHPLLAKKSVSAREFSKEPFVLREEGSGTRAVVERAFGRKGLKIRPVMSLGSPEAIKKLVAAGLGVAVVSRLIVEQELKHGALCILKLVDLEIRRPLHCQQLKGRALSQVSREFLEILGRAAGGCSIK